MRLTLPAAATAAVLIFTVAPAAASASTTLTKSGSTIAVVATGADSSDLDLDATGGSLEAYDFNGLALTPGAGCVADGPSGVSCDLTGVTKLTVDAGAGDDYVTVQGALPAELRGDGGFDHLQGGAGADVLDGGTGEDTLIGGLGNDQLIGGNGIDHFEGGLGDDDLMAADTLEDDFVSCGAGDDDLDHDLVDPFETDCEVIAPEVTTDPKLEANAWQVGATAAATGLVVSAKPVTGMTIALRWERCSGGTCTLAQTVPSNDTRYTIQAADQGKNLRVVVEATNRAGTKVLASAQTPAIAAAPVVPTTPQNTNTTTTTTTTRPIGGIPAGLTPADLAGMIDRAGRPSLKQVGTKLGAGLDAAVKPLAKVKLRKLAAQATTTVPVLLPADGTVTVTWSVTPATARKLGLKAKGKAPVVLATGSRRGSAGVTVPVQVKPTAAGRRALRKARTVKLTLTASLQTQDGPATATKTVTLRR